MSGRESWKFKVKEIPGGDLCLYPEQQANQLPRERANGKKPGVLDSWNIQFVLPSGTDYDDASRIAELLNEWVREVACTVRAGQTA